MGRFARNKRKSSNPALGKDAGDAGMQGMQSLSQALALVPTIGNVFLRERVADYAEFAEMLVDELDQSQQKSTPNNVAIDDLRLDLKYFGKQARRLDLILAIAGSANYLSAQDKATAYKIQLTVETKLSAFVEQQGKGTLVFSTANGEIKTETYSNFGRGIARLLAGVVPVSAVDKGKNILPQSTFLPDEVNERVKADLAAARAHGEAGRLGEAKALYENVLKTDRKNGEALRSLGQLYIKAGNSSVALVYLEQARSFYAKDISFLAEIGSLLIENGRYEEAIQVFQEALRIKPSAPFLLMDLGRAYFFGGKDKEAITALNDTLNLSPNSADALALLGGIHSLLKNDYEKSLFFYSRALKIEPRNVAALLGYGVLLHRWRKSEAGLDLLDRGLQVEPQNIDFAFIKACILLSLGRFEEGWALYERGLLSPNHRRVRLISGKPVWKGESDPRMKLLIGTEQGIGDAIQFVRYAASCKERVGKVFVLCPKPVERLFKCCPAIDKVFTVVRNGQFDAQISMMSLPHLLGTTLNTIPANVPYFFLPQKLQAQWKSRFSPSKSKLKVGLVWSGSMFNQAIRGDLRAKRRNIDLKQLLPLFDCKDVVFCNLQLGDGAKQIAELGLQDRFVDYMSEVKDMLDTAAIIEQLDLVISVDTSVAHLAGALGKPVWILSRYDACWRWLENRPTSPWYPTARIFGQPKDGGWAPVIQEVAAALNEKLIAFKDSCRNLAA